MSEQVNEVVTGEVIDVDPFLNAGPVVSASGPNPGTVPVVVDVDIDVNVGSAKVEEEKVFVEGVSFGLIPSAESLALPPKEDIDVRKAAIKDRMVQILQLEDKIQLMAGEILHEILNNRYFADWEFVDAGGNLRKFTSFDEYVNEGLQYQRRKAYYLIDIYKTFVLQLGIPREELKSIEWSKAKELTKIVNTSNWRQVLDDVKGMSSKQVIEYAKNFRKPPSAVNTTTTTPADTTAPVEVDLSAIAPKDNFITKKIPLTPDQEKIIDQALTIGKRLTGSDSAGQLLAMMATEYITSHLNSTDVSDLVGDINTHITNLEKIFGVKVTFESIDAAVIPNLKEVQ